MLFIHILSAAIAIGPLFGVFPILNRMKEAQDAKILGMIEGLRGSIRAIELAGHVLVPSGLVLIWLGGWSWTTSWVIVTILVMLGSLFFLARAFKPAWRLVSAEDFSREQFITVMKNATIKYIVIMLIMLWLMVAKPHFW
ncbi:hypothetical protein [Lysinibacillus sp. 54212]|uniref:hypothetical protein n=1 Tax=Lysinibacillus sp. 54212 TaxID=3119829 RepID=UPI002FC871FF